jgi:hypothetical protein
MRQEMNEAEFQRLREESWRRKLTAEEESRLAACVFADSDAQADWEAESALTHVLSQLPDAPMASNFTAQVMHAIDRDSATEPNDAKPRLALGEWLCRRLPRVAWATLSAACVLLACAAYQYRQIRRAELVESVVRVSTVASVIKPEVFRDFDAIALLSQLPADDSELMTLK